MECCQYLKKVTDKKNARWMKYLFPLFVALLTCVLYHHFFVNKAYVTIELEVDRKTELKIYWAGVGQPYCEKNKVKVVVTPHSRNYKFFLTNISQVRKLRIDTHSYRGDATLRSLVVRQEGWMPLSLTSPEELKRLMPLNQIGEYGVDKTGVHVTSTDTEPSLEMSFTPECQGREIGWLILRFVAIIIVVFLVLHGAGTLMQELRFVPLLLFGVWTLIITMAGVSQPYAHSDEKVHMAAVSYYRDHWLPPLIEDPEIRQTYSLYGFSRLNNGEVYYLFAGKFNKLLDGFRLPDSFSLRGFNVFLFGLLLLLTINNRYARMVAIPFLVSPQIWYLFSYCNSDAFALFCAFLAGCQLIDPESLLHRYFKDDKRVSKIVGAVILSVFIGILLLLKKNYYPFLLFAYLCLGVKLFHGEDFLGERKEALKRLAIITLAGLLIFGLRIGSDYMVNGLDRQEKLVRIQDKVAPSLFKASTESHEKHFELNLKARGIGLQEMIEQDHWFERSFRTGFGVFGCYTISAPDIYYDLIRWTGVFLLLFVFGSIFWRGGLAGSGLAVSVLGLSVALIGASLYHSWTADFEPQGRYLLPIIPMLGILYAPNHETVNGRLLVAGVILMYLLGIYS